MKDLLKALQHCHSKGIIHADIKAGNILLNRIGVVQLCDFGLVYFNDNDNDNVTSAAATTTTAASAVAASCTSNNETVQHQQPYQETKIHAMCTLHYRSLELLFGYHPSNNNNNNNNI